MVDNNSTDDTKDIARKFTDKVFNQGPERSAQRNYGAAQAKGEYLLIHDSDIYFAKTSVAECVELLADGKYQSAILPEESIGNGYWTKIKAYERSFYVGNDYIEAARFFRTDLYNKLGGYDETLTGPEDWDLTIRIREAGYKIGRTKSFLLHDEGELNLFGSTKKKAYYANDMGKYAAKHPDWFKKQMSFLVRFTPQQLAAAVLSHPIKLVSMIIMKGLEFVNAKR